MTQYHIVRHIHPDPSFYKTGQSPLRARSSSKNHPIQCIVLQENNVWQLSRVRLGEAHLCLAKDHLHLGEVEPHLQDCPRLHQGEAHFRLGKLLRFGEAHLFLGEAKPKIWTSATQNFTRVPFFNSLHNITCQHSFTTKINVTKQLHNVIIKPQSGFLYPCGPE